MVPSVETATKQLQPLPRTQPIIILTTILLSPPPVHSKAVNNFSCPVPCTAEDITIFLEMSVCELV
jgi:hypothetical protein